MAKSRKSRSYNRDLQGRFASGGSNSRARRALRRIGGAISGHNKAIKAGRKK